MPSSRPTRSKQRSKELPDNSKSKFTLQSFVRAFPSAPELTYFQPGLLAHSIIAENFLSIAVDAAGDLYGMRASTASIEYPAGGAPAVTLAPVSYFFGGVAA